MFLSSGAISQQVAAAAPGAPVAADVDMVFVVPPGGGIDVTAPVLSSASAATNGAEAFTASVSTDEGAGSLYWVVTTSATTPGAAQIRNGQDHTGAAAVASGAQDVNATGAQDVAGSGLTAETAYHVHFHQLDAAASPNASAVASASFTTAAAASSLTVVAARHEVFDTAATSHAPSEMPARQAGDLIVVVGAAKGSPTMTMAGYAKIAQEAHDFLALDGAIFTRTATGDASDDIALALSTSQMGGMSIYVVRGWTAFDGHRWDEGAGTTLDPGSLTFAGGSGDYLVISSAIGDSADGWAGGTAPSGYSGFDPGVPEGFADSASTDNCSVAGAWKAVTGASEDAGVWTYGGFEQFVVATMAVR